MIEIAQQRVPRGTFLVGDALELPFDDQSFDRIFTGHFYGHLEDQDRHRFLAEARRVAASSSSRTRLERIRPWPRSSSRACSRTALSGRSTSATSRATGCPRSSAAEACCAKTVGSSPYARLDAAPLVVSLDHVTAARQPQLPGVRRGRISDRVASGRRRVRRPARVHVRPGARGGRGSRAQAVAGPCGPDASPLARHGGGRVLRHLLLRLGHAVLPGPRAVRRR